MYHLRLKGEHYQMGVKRGKIFQKCNITFPLHLDDFQMKYGRESERILKGYFPEVCEEIRGISDTIGVGYITFASWLLCMGCCMLIWKIISLSKLGVVLLLLIPKTEKSFMDVTMICPRI